MELSEEKLAEIQARLPNAIEIQQRLLLPVDMLAFKTGPGQKVDIAAVCLQDASKVTCEAIYALGQAYMSLAWFREEHPEAPRELDACFQGKFYADDVALRLYAAAEHVANFIIAFLNIQNTELESYQERHTSLASTVGNYLIAEKPKHDITLIVKKLIDEKNWGRSMKYRNIWVHEQPPLIEGMGIVYERKPRWMKMEKGFVLGIGRGDEPQYTVDSLLDMVSSATYAFVNVLLELSNILLDYLKNLGIEIDPVSGRVDIKLK